jgi:hypothetical protein
MRLNELHRRPAFDCGLHDQHKWRLVNVMPQQRQVPQQTGRRDDRQSDER